MASNTKIFSKFDAISAVEAFDAKTATLIQ
jgi:hypothetical protein